jgi:hypothetical protein
MPECTYCEQTFEDNEAYLAHLAEEHEDALGRIETRRVAAFRTASSSRRIPPWLLLLLLILNSLLLAGVVFVLVSTG